MQQLLHVVKQEQAAVRSIALSPNIGGGVTPDIFLVERSYTSSFGFCNEIRLTASEFGSGRILAIRTDPTRKSWRLGS
jgi:hypothetical protein